MALERPQKWPKKNKIGQAYGKTPGYNVDKLYIQLLS